MLFAFLTFNFNAWPHLAEREYGLLDVFIKDF